MFFSGNADLGGDLVVFSAIKQGLAGRRTLSVNKISIALIFAIP